MKSTFFRISILVLIFSTITIVAAPVDHWFEKGNQFYQQQQFDSAAVYYEKIIESGTNNSSVLYNLGNSYFRQKKIGLARLYYERATRLAPNDPDIQTNIKFVNASIADRVPESERGFFGSILFRLHTTFSLQAQMWIVLALLLSLSVLIASCFFVAGNARLWFIYLSVLISIFIFFLGLSTTYKIYDTERGNYAIVLNQSAEVRNEPEGNKVLFIVHEGTKFRIRKSLESWSLVNLPNGYSGWVETSTLGKI